MWSNISAPKSGLKAAQVGHQVKHDPALDQEQENNHHQELSSPFSSKTNSGSPLMRYKHAVCSSLNGFIYIHGGRFANGVSLDDDVWRFDPHENRWLQLRTSGCKPPSLQEHTLSEYEGSLYLFGGLVSASSGRENFFWRLDLAKCQWVSLNMNASNCSSLKYGARLGPTNRRGHSACIYRDSIYIFGGYEDFRGSTNQLWQYDLLNERWELRNLSSSSACHPEPRHNHSAIIYQDNMYVYGGLSNLKPLGDLWRWSWKDKRWFREKTRGQSPGQLHGHTAIQAFGSMFVFGGERQNGRTTRSLWRLNLSNLCWQKIKPKGPRPNPTTWHAAIANPLGILDEANYLIEGDASDLELDQHQQEELMLVINQQQQSLSDDCLSTTMQQTVPIETIRPAMLNSANNQSRSAETELKLQQQQQTPQGSLLGHQQHQQKSFSRLKVSKSSSEQMSYLAKQAAGQSKDRMTKSKRRIRLSFLRRNNKSKKGTELRQLSTSWSAASILNTSAVDGTEQRLRKQPPVNETKRHSIAIPSTNMESDVEMVDLGPNLDLANECQLNADQASDTNVGILDSLDTDIKQMFQRALSPSGDANKEFEQQPRLDRTVRDSLTQSQLSSCIGQTSTQTYRTAREQLSSQSTLTITSPVENQSNVAATSTCAPNKQLSDTRQRKSMHQFIQTQSRRHMNEGAQYQHQQARGRPKSEIVQSLIDRADARIKHLYTPYFNANQQQQQTPRFNSNEPILGELANHRMFQKSTALDKSKRHTIHQTMTYYNLYFGEDRRLDSSSGADSSNSPPVANDIHQDDDKISVFKRQPTSATNGTSGVSTNDKSLVNSSNSTSAALIGVHDGASSSGGDSSQRTSTTLGRLESEVGSLMQNSDSRTLCGDLNNIDHFHQQRQHFEEAERQNQRMSEFAATSDDLNNSADNTSLSFSVIAEFEEDDMLQYSSPTDPSIGRSVRNEHDMNNGAYDDDDEEDEDDEELERVEQYDGHLSHGDEINQQQNESNTTKAHMMVPQKSTSSGYDSIRSTQSSTNGRGKQHHQQQQQDDDENNHQHDPNELGRYSGASSNDGSPRAYVDSSPGQHHQNHEQHFPPAITVKREPGAPITNATTASSTTVESLALTTNDTNTSDPMTPPSKSLPSSPPDLSQASSTNPTGRQNSSFASSLMSGPSRLFGKKRTKTRYWQLCMFVIGGKQQGGNHNTGNLNEPITIWRLYI